MDDFYALHDLPNKLRTFDTTVINDGSGNDERCMICLYEFKGTNEEEYPDEVPCKPLRLKPCGHYIGDQCLRRLAMRGIHTCQLCRRQIRVATRATLPPYLARIKDCEIFQDLSLTIVQEIEHSTHADSYRQCCEQLVDGKLGITGALWLWILQVWGLLMWPIRGYSICLFSFYGLYAVTGGLSDLSAPFSGSEGVAGRNHLFRCLSHATPQLFPDIQLQEPVDPTFEGSLLYFAWWLWWNLGYGAKHLADVDERIEYYGYDVVLTWLLAWAFDYSPRGTAFMLGLSVFVYAAITALLIGHAMRARAKAIS